MGMNLDFAIAIQKLVEEHEVDKDMKMSTWEVGDYIMDTLRLLKRTREGITKRHIEEELVGE